MKLLLDQNVSPQLAARLADLFPESAHVYVLGLDRASDVDVWLYAREHGYVVLSKDVDYSDLSLLLGHPPKLLWLRIGNCTTKQIETLLRERYDAIKHMYDDPVIGVLSLM